MFLLQATQNGNFISRINHSCEPNCKLKRFIDGKKLKLGVWAKEDIAQGEEITIDFREKSDFERELQGFSCLCGSENCEKSFVSISSSSSPINKVLSEKYSIMHRTKNILDSFNESGITKNALCRLARYGFKDLIFEDNLGSSVSVLLPDWLKSWTCQTLKFIEEESHELKANVHSVAENDEKSSSVTLNDISQLLSSRVRLLAIALDKAKIFLRNQSLELRDQPPIRQLSDSEVVNYLWTSSSSIASRYVAY